MKKQNVVWKKMLKASMAGSIVIAPVIMGTSPVQAAPQTYAQTRVYRSYNVYVTLTGRVTSVESSSRFNVEVGNSVYNVYLSTNAPRRLDRGDIVRVYGQRYGDNDIRNASVSIITNTPGNGSTQWGDFQTFTGRVTSVESNSRFNIKDGNTEYNVYLSTNAPRRLDKDDIVRVYGRRYGNNDIRNANVSIIANTPGNGSNQWGNYQTFTGRVTSEESTSRFNIQVGNTEYNVYLSTNAPRRLDRGDIVRVYGRRYGDNDIRNASVRILANTPGNGYGQWGDYRTFTGRVTSVESNSRFNIKDGNTEYNVYLSTSAPRMLDKDDIVRVYGRRYGNNDIRNASVSIIANTPGNGSTQWGDYQTFTGIAGTVQDQRFRLEVGGTTYDVYASSRLPAELDRGDRVRVYGRRYGDNDIRNATVVVIRNR